jgi:hypothetical protein
LQVVWEVLCSQVLKQEIVVIWGTTGVVGQQGLLPTIEDPKLWLVELKAGTEREAVICLMQKAVDLAAKGTPLLIKSAFVQDHLKVG